MNELGAILGIILGSLTLASVFIGAGKAWALMQMMAADVKILQDKMENGLMSKVEAAGLIQAMLSKDVEKMHDQLVDLMKQGNVNAQNLAVLKEHGEKGD